MAEGGRSQRVNAAIIVFARLDSSRLPGKALKPIAGKLLLDRVIDRCLGAHVSAPVIVATSDRQLDDAIADHVAGRGETVFRGAANDVAGRALACAEAHGLDRFARISGDSPFIDPDLIARCLARSREGDAELVTNVFPRSFPIGVSVEVITRPAMRRIVAETDDPADREHVTRYAYRQANSFRLENVSAPDDRYAGVSLSVDTQADYDKACWIFETHGDDIDLDTAAAAARQWETRQSETRK
jgi:spore coat polysaccharide biosynthesis protein SpsF